MNAPKLICDKCGEKTTAGLTPGRVPGGTHIRVNQRRRGMTCGTWREPEPVDDMPSVHGSVYP